MVRPLSILITFSIIRESGLPHAGGKGHIPPPRLRSLHRSLNYLGLQRSPRVRDEVGVELPRDDGDREGVPAIWGACLQLIPF